MDSVTDICKYHFLCFVTIIQVKVTAYCLTVDPEASLTDEVR